MVVSVSLIVDYVLWGAAHVNMEETTEVRYVENAKGEASLQNFLTPIAAKQQSAISGLEAWTARL